jgi:purine-binding chemotaxis protein CheW
MNSQVSSRGPAAPGACDQMLTFVLDKEDYGVDILRVQEIRGWSGVTRIPRSAPDVLGVIHLRGAVVPIVDLRLRFALGQAEYNAMTVIIVLTVLSQDGSTEIGVVVDGVNEVVNVDSSQLRPAPDLGARQATEYVTGILPNGERMVVMLDVDRLLCSSTAASERAA